MLTYIELQQEVKRRALRNQAGTEFDTPIKNAINSSIFRIARDAPWRVMRRTAHFDTVTSYTSGTGSVSVTNSSTAWHVTGTSLLVDKIRVGRKVKFGTDSHYYTIRTIHAESSSSLDMEYLGTTSTATSYEILPQEEYVIPMEAGHRMFLWHEALGYPYKMTYLTDQNFYGKGAYLTEKDTPTHYRMWGEDNAIIPLTTSTFLSIESSVASDTLTNVTLFGNINGYPGSETITTSASNGTFALTTTNLFDTFNRAAVSSTTNGHIIVRTGSETGAQIVSVIPQGNAKSVMRRRIQLYPLPTTVFPINVYYYKDPLPLVDEGDVHDMGEDFDEAVILLATAKIKYQDDQKEGDRFISLYQEELRSLRKTNLDEVDWFPTLQRPRGSGDAFVRPNLSFKQVGPFYGPSGR